MTDNLIDFFNEPARIVIRKAPDAEPEEYVLHPLTMKDRIEAQAYIRNQRIDSFLNQRQVHALQPNVVASALADIQCKPIDTEEILRGHESQLYLLFLSLKRAKPSITWEQVKTLPSMTTQTLTRILFAITGLIDESKTTEDTNAAADPTSSTGTPSASTAPSGRS